MKKVTIFCLLLFLGGIIPGSVVLFFAQEKPIPTGTFETEHFRIQMEIPWKHQRPTPQETGAMLEQFYSVMDRYFGKPIALKRTQTGQTQALSPGKITVCFLNEEESYRHHIIQDGNVFHHGHTGYYYLDPKKIYLYRSAALIGCRRILFHEAVHAYQDTVFPGSYSGYPEWWQECMASHFEDHVWDGHQLRIDFMPPFTREGYVDRVFDVLLDMKTRIRQKLNNPQDSPGRNASRRQREVDETSIDFDLLTEYFTVILDYRKFEPNDPRHGETREKFYAFCWGLGKYLFLERRKELTSILTDMSNDPNLTSKTDQDATKNAFRSAFIKAFEKKPIKIEAMERWLITQQPKWETVFREWQFTNQMFFAKTEGSSPEKTGSALLLHRIPNRIPAFTVRPVPGDWAVGLGRRTGFKLY